MGDPTQHEPGAPRAELGVPRGGAVEELVRDPSSRRRFLAMAGGAGTVTTLSLFAAACGSDDDEEVGFTASPAGDLSIVNFALTLEYLEADYYDQVVDGRILSGRELELAKLIRENEHDHVDALISTAKKLGKPAGRPESTFEAVLAGGRGRVIQTAAELENLGAAAYLGQARAVASREVLASALAIHSVEARHAAVLNFIAGRPPLPDGALATPLTRSEVLRRAEPYLVA